ncbi:MAG: DUF3883 domain-containing protein [Gammaproteobacteria bacterium]|nr:DUF3883 domain-containing protein [Gammaproteobacteria bacterium]
MSRRSYIEQLAENNREQYGTDDGLAMLGLLELAFEHPWIYVFELVQNAVDAGARSISVQIADDQDGLVFQHDGRGALGPKEVEGLSKVSRSTKGAASVGFMGIGFKSVFGRFLSAHVSGWGWKFRYDIPVSTGDFGDVHIDPLGAVLPRWDDGIAEPDGGFTTRFELHGRRDRHADLADDLARFMRSEDRTLLAILADAGVRRLAVGDSVWTLSVDDDDVDGCAQVTALCGDLGLKWCLFAVAFSPSRAAIAKFLERRQIHPSAADKAEVYAAASAERRVLGVLPLDERGVPAPPTRGRVYATLPTTVEIPFGLHVQADWLLNISRTSLGEIEDDAWQRDIADRIADLVAVFLKWVARTLRKRESATAAYGALRLPVPERSGLEAILSEPRWLHRLRDELRNAQVVPVWTDDSGAVAFETPGRTYVPPAPLGRAFDDEPAMKPASLFKGRVLARKVLGSTGRELLMAIGLMKEMQQRDIEDAWQGGLEHWWSRLAGNDDGEKRDLLFRLWAALWESATSSNWSVNGIRCVRTVAGSWRSAHETSFFNEALPSDEEPGGHEIREIMEGFIDWGECIPEAWTQVIRRAASREWRSGFNTSAREFLETNARSVALSELIGHAAVRVDEADPVDVAAIVSMGLWARHRGRGDLLVRVLAETTDGLRGVTPESALVSAPYVRGQDREALFPGMPVIADRYLEGVPVAEPAEWRVFFQDAGAKGGVVVEAIRERQAWTSEDVGDYLGRELGGHEYSNSAGYALQDFVIKPLPGFDAPARTRRAVGAWLDDGFEALRGKGRRQASYTYRTAKVAKGKKASRWVKELSSLPWVPCSNGELRRPGEALSERDATRPDASTSVLSADLVAALQAEGVKFGTEVPESPALLRLQRTGDQLSPTAFAELLREVRASVASTEERGLFEEVLRTIGIPQKPGEFVPVARIVRRVGGGRLRGRLGGWVVPLEDFPEDVRSELEQPEFPVKVAETTTGQQTLEFLRDVWRRAVESPDRLANEVRDVLPLAYAYCVEDCEEDAALKDDWRRAVTEAAVFVDRGWVGLADVAEDVFLDDVDDRRFLPAATNVRTVTAGHLGETLVDQARVAGELGLPLLSESVDMDWRECGSVDAARWTPRFRHVCELVAWARAGERGSTSAGIDTSWTLRKARELVLQVRFQGGEAEKVLVHARLHDGVLTVAGRPIEFGADAAKELLHKLGFGQRGDLSADLTAMLMAIDDDLAFGLAAEKFRRSFAPDFVAPEFQDGEEADAGFGDRETEQSHPGTSDESDGGEETETASVDWGEQNSGGSREGSSEPEQEEATRDGDATEGGDTPKDPEDGGGSSSFTAERRLAMQRAAAEELRRAKDALREALVGEMAEPPNSEPDSGTEVEEEAGPTGDGRLGDEIYRLVAAEYERNCGREPKLGAASQPGWDLRSTDTASGVERLIEVKGKGCLWEKSEVVELSRAQVRKAFGELQASRLWYLYVVEHIGGDEYVVLPIQNPVGTASGWILSGNGWREAAEDEGQVVLSGEAEDVGGDL